MIQSEIEELKEKLAQVQKEKDEYKERAEKSELKVSERAHCFIVSSLPPKFFGLLDFYGQTF